VILVLCRFPVTGYLHTTKITRVGLGWRGTSRW